MSRCTLRFCRLFVCALLGCCAAAPARAASQTSKDAPTPTQPAASAPAASQTNKAPAPSDTPAVSDQDKMMAEMMKYANPGPPHAMLKPLEGSWKTTSKVWQGPGEPQVTTGTCERSWLLGGRFLQGVIKGTMLGQPFEGLQLLGYDLKKKEYVSFWVDNMSTSASMDQGQMDAAGKVLTIRTTFDDPASGQSIPYRMVTKIVSPDQHVFTMTGMKDGREWTEMEITYDRVKK